MSTSVCCAPEDSLLTSDHLHGDTSHRNQTRGQSPCLLTVSVGSLNTVSVGSLNSSVSCLLTVGCPELTSDLGHPAEEVHKVLLLGGSSEPVL